MEETSLRSGSLMQMVQLAGPWSIVSPSVFSLAGASFVLLVGGGCFKFDDRLFLADDDDDDDNDAWDTSPRVRFLWARTAAGGGNAGATAVAKRAERRRPGAAT
jgi:hypothetical protein